MDTLDIKEHTYVDDDGNTHNSLDYLMRDGNLAVPGGRYGSWTDDCALIAIMLCIIYEDSSGDPTSIDSLEGAMFSVVNSSDEVCWSVLDARHALEHLVENSMFGKVKLDPYAYFDDEEIEYSRELWMTAYCGNSGEPCPF